jgi:lipoyl(octanoyl) transferase
MLDLRRRQPDIRAYVAALEAWIIAALARFGVTGERREDRVGVWVRRPEKPPLPDGRQAEDKIAAIGIRMRRWVSFHGVSLNVDPDLGHYSGIVPCGVTGYGVTSLADLGLPVSMPELDAALRAAFEPIFGPTEAVEDQKPTAAPRPPSDRAAGSGT